MGEVAEFIWQEAFSSGTYFRYSRAVDGFSLQDDEEGELIPH